MPEEGAAQAYTHRRDRFEARRRVPGYVEQRTDEATLRSERIGGRNRHDVWVGALTMAVLARGEAKVLLRIALRNLVASRAKTLIIGGIILLGTVLVVVGSSLLDSLDRGMRSSIQGSLGGHLQLYNARSKDDLALYGGMMGESDLEPIEDFARVKQALARVPHVKTIVPMGIDQAMVATGNPLDVALEKLRADVRRLEGGDRVPGGALRTQPAAGWAEALRAYDAHKAHVRRMIRVLRDTSSRRATSSTRRR